MKQMYFRTNYKDTLLPSGALLMKGHWYDVLDDYDEGYLICNIPECTIDITLLVLCCIVLSVL